jgi:putative tricarboxylic transport membrane protein
MYVGNVMLLILNLPLIPLWVRILRVPYRVLFPLIILFVIIGTYSVNSSIFDVALAVVFGGIGYLLRKFKFEITPLIMAFVLGPMIDESLRQSLIISQGSLDIFVSRPFSFGFLLLGVFIVFSSCIPMWRKWKRAHEHEICPWLFSFLVRGRQILSRRRVKWALKTFGVHRSSRLVG